MIKTIFSALELASWAKKLSIVAVAVVTLVTVYGIWHYKVWSRGYDRALADVAKQDSKPVEPVPYIDASPAPIVAEPAPAPRDPVYEFLGVRGNNISAGVQ